MVHEVSSFYNIFCVFAASLPLFFGSVVLFVFKMVFGRFSCKNM